MSDRVWRLPELQAEAARLAWPAQAAQVLTAWNSADHSAELGRYYTRLVAAGAWHQCLDLADAQSWLSKATERVRGPWWPWVYEVGRQQAQTGEVTADVPTYAVACWETWAAAVKNLLDALDAADAVLAAA